jgi:hypothetical protein
MLRRNCEGVFERARRSVGKRSFCGLAPLEPPQTPPKVLGMLGGFPPILFELAIRPLAGGIAGHGGKLVKFALRDLGARAAALDSGQKVSLSLIGFCPA